MKIIIMALPFLLFSGPLSSQDFHSSWLSPATLCSNDPFFWDEFGPSEAFPISEYNTCIKPFENISQVWIKFKLKSSGNVAFTLKPNGVHDDIDFALFTSNNGVPINNLRCIAAGLDLDKGAETQKNCTGQTGLASTAQDSLETSGCDDTKDNFLAAYNGLQGDEFLVLITNYRSSSGFSFVWTGTADIDGKACEEEGNISKSYSIQVIPNPTTSKFICNVESPGEQLIELYIVNSIGAEYFRKKFLVLPGKNELPVTESDFPTGHYFAILKQNDRILEYTNFEIVK